MNAMFVVSLLVIGLHILDLKKDNTIFDIKCIAICYTCNRRSDSCTTCTPLLRATIVLVVQKDHRSMRDDDIDDSHE